MAASLDRSLFFANQFAISCGTISLDVGRSKLLIIRWRKTGEYLLPKGRKDVGESLEHAATRETFEETGIPVKLLPIHIKSMATLPASMTGTDGPNAVTEPLAVTQRMNNGTLKIIFWYVATADSTAVPQQGTQDEGEDFDTVWVAFDDIESVLSFEDDRRVAQAAIAAVCQGN